MGAAKPAEKSPRGVVAEVNDERVPAWEYNALLKLNLQTLGLAAATSPASPRWAAVRARTLRQVVDEALLNAYAQAHGLAAAPAAVDAQLEVYRLQSGAGFGPSLSRLGLDVAQLRRMVARNLNAQAVTRRVIDGIAAPALRVQVVQVAVPTRAQAQRVRAALLGGADAALLAARESSDPTLRRLAGQLPPLTRAEGDALYGAGWSAAAFMLRPGEISAPLHLRVGWAVIEVVERQPAPALMQRALDGFVSGLRRAARITTYAR